MGALEVERSPGALSVGELDGHRSAGKSFKKTENSPSPQQVGKPRVDRVEFETALERQQALPADPQELETGNHPQAICRRSRLDPADERHSVDEADVETGRRVGARGSIPGNGTHQRSRTAIRSPFFVVGQFEAARRRIGSRQNGEMRPGQVVPASPG